MFDVQQVREEELHERRVLGVECVEQRSVVVGDLHRTEHDLRQRVVHTLLAQTSLLLPDCQHISLALQQASTDCCDLRSCFTRSTNPALNELQDLLHLHHLLLLQIRQN